MCRLHMSAEYTEMQMTESTFCAQGYYVARSQRAVPDKHLSLQRVGRGIPSPDMNDILNE
jgi:hypothetical protein